MAEPLGWDPVSAASWWGEVPGQHIAVRLLGPDGPALAHQLGAGLGALARAPLSPHRAEPPASQLARTGRAVGRAARATPELGPRLDAAYAVLVDWHARLDDRPLHPVHGAPHMHQWLQADGTLGLVDFDRYAAGEPELDAATLLGELEFEGERWATMTDLCAAVVNGYARAGVRLDPDRLSLYRVHKHVAKVARTATSTRPDRAARAARHLFGVEAALGLGSV